MTMRAAILTILIAVGLSAGAADATIDNDAGCDLSLLPAATLLLPYFEVDLASGPGLGETTIFTITNVANIPQAARVTLWTDLGYPVITFNIYLTGYDVQSINLYDFFARGRIAPNDGTGSDVSPVGKLSGTSPTRDFDNPLLAESTCVDFPVQLPPNYISPIQRTFTTGDVDPLPHDRTRPACQKIGEPHVNAIGYATIDVVGTCTYTLPNEPRYFSDEILFDNVLTGDYVQLRGKDHVVQAGPLVHIRAIPEGGSARSRVGDARYLSRFPRTFYSRYQHPERPRSDARQPLPSVFVARFLGGRRSEPQSFLKIWREGREFGTACNVYSLRNRTALTEVIRFDEEENPSTHAPSNSPYDQPPNVPLAFMTDVNRGGIVPSYSDEPNGWIYVNLDGYYDNDNIPTQGWVISSMHSGGYSVDLPATALGNGCSALVAPTDHDGTPPIGPAPNVRR